MSEVSWSSALERLAQTRQEEVRLLQAALLVGRETGFVNLTLPRVQAYADGVSVASLTLPLSAYGVWPSKDAIAFSYLDAALIAAFDCAGRSFHAGHTDGAEHVPDTRSFRWFIQGYFQCLVRILDRERELVWECLGAALLRWPLYAERLAVQRSDADRLFLNPDDLQKGNGQEPTSIVGFARDRGLIEEPTPEVYHAIRATLWSYTWAVVLRWHTDTAPHSQATRAFIEQTARFPAAAVQCHWLFDADSLENFLLANLWRPLEAQLQGAWLPASVKRILDLFTKPKGGLNPFLASLPTNLKATKKPTMGSPGAAPGDAPEDGPNF